MYSTIKVRTLNLLFIYVGTSSNWSAFLNYDRKFYQNKIGKTYGII